MARQKGLIKLTGTMGGITFYKSKQDGYLAREKGGVEADRIANDPNFARTRENNSEFANVIKAGKILRDTFRVLAKDASDSRVTARMTKTFSRIKNMDTFNVRGERSVAEGIKTVEGKTLLQGFDFNKKSLLNQVLFIPFESAENGTIIAAQFTPLNDMRIPEGCTHVIMQAGMASINFKEGISDIFISEKQRIGIAEEIEDFEILVEERPDKVGEDLYFISIQFIQELNGVDYPFKNNQHNVLNVYRIESFEN